MSNLSFDRKTANGNAYSKQQAEDLICQWTEIAKSLEEKDLRSIQKDLTSKVNNKERIPDEFFNSNHLVYQVASVVTKELLVRRNQVQENQLEALRAAHNERLKAVYGKK